MAVPLLPALNTESRAKSTAMPFHKTREFGGGMCVLFYFLDILIYFDIWAIYKGKVVAFYEND